MRRLAACLVLALAVVGCVKPMPIATPGEAKERNDLDWTIETEPGESAPRNAP